MIKFKAKDLKRRGDVLILPAFNEYEGSFIVIVGNNVQAGKEKRMQAYCLATSSTKGPMILEQTRGAIPAFNALIAINRALTKWQMSGKDAKKTELEAATRSRIKTIMRFAKLLEIDDLVADRTEFEAHFS